MAAEKDLIALSESRSSVYRMLSGLLFRELVPSQIEAMESLPLDPDSFGNAEMASGFGMMQHFLKTYLGDTRQELACDFAHTILAIGAQNRRMALPYESVFTSREGLLMQESRDDVYLTYRREHVALAEGTDLPEDHLAFMLEFVAVLCDRFSSHIKTGELEAAENNLKTQAAFTESHIENWMDNYCSALEASALTEFYQGLASVLHGWIEADRAFRTDLSDALDRLVAR